MRAIWTGAITFGLVTVPVKLYAATDDHGVKLHQVHEPCAAVGGRISAPRVCKDCGETVAHSDLVKGVESPDLMDGSGRPTIVLTEAELGGLPSAGRREIAVMEFVDPAGIDPMLLDTPYYLTPPDPPKAASRSGATPLDTAPRTYALLREALRASGLVAVVRVVLRTRESLAILQVCDDVIVMRTMRWADEVRVLPVILPAAVSDAEMDMAGSLVKAMARKFDPDRHTDLYQAGLVDLIEAKQAA